MANLYKNKVVYDGRTIIDISDTTATADKIAVGYGCYGADGAWIDGTAQNATVVITEETDSHGGIIKHINTDGAIDLSNDTVTPSTLLSGTTAHDKTGAAITGTYTPPAAPSYQSKTVSPTESQQTVTPDQNYDALSSVTVEAISSTYVGTGITRRSSSDLTASGATITAPAGYYSAAASKSVASGTAGTPTATKGTVSNHSVSVTPSVTNSTGYITGGTKSGTAVTVSASELVSGSETKTENGTYDVTNLASLVVAIPLQHYYTGSGTPSSSLGANGDIYLQTS